MKKVFVIFLAAAALTGCKGSQKGASGNPGGETGLGGLTIPKERIYTTSELQIGRRICSALKTKRELFEKVVDQKEQIKFRGENRNCENLIYNNSDFVAKVSNVGSGNLEYIAKNRNNYLNDVITDQNGAMKIICDNLVVSDSVSNTVLSGSSYLIVNLLISSGYDRIEISKKTQGSDGNYSLVSIEGVNVYTQANQINSKFFGVEQERIRYTPCSNSKNSAYIKQNWVTAITSF